MKRSAAESGAVVLQEEKRRREAHGSIVVAGGNSGSKYGEIVRARTSNLESPIMRLSGSKGEVLAMKFCPQGTTLATAGVDRLIYIWSVFGNCPNLHRLKGHDNAILDLQYSKMGDQLYTASADHTVCLWDIERLERIKKIKASTEIVNAVATTSKGDPVLVAGGDDGVVRTWDVRAPRRAALELDQNVPVTGVAASLSGDQIFASNTSGDIVVWETRSEAVLYTLKGHGDVATSVALSPDGSSLLSNGADDTLRIWDVRPFVSGGDEARCTKVLTGHQVCSPCPLPMHKMTHTHTHVHTHSMGLTKTF